MGGRIKKVHGFTPTMLNMSDLVYETQAVLLDSVNATLDRQSLHGTTTIADAIWRSRPSHFRSREEHDATKDTLTEVFGDGTDILDEYMLAWRWKDQRVIFTHPLKNISESDKKALRIDVGFSDFGNFEYKLIST